MAKNNFGNYPLPNWLQSYMERNIGRSPVWQFPHIPASPEGLFFEKLDFQNRHHVLEMFENDPDPWVDERFKDPQQLYEYVAHLRIVMPYAGKRGGADWLVRKGGEYAGLLHAFEFSRENFGYNHRKCAIGFAFAQKYRGAGTPFHAVKYFQDFLFQKMGRLYLTASVKRENLRSIRFLKNLGFEERSPDWEEEADQPKVLPEEIYLDLFRSPQAKGRIRNYWKMIEEEYRARRAGGSGM